MASLILTRGNPTGTEPHKGIRFLGSRITPKRHRFCFSVLGPTVKLWLTTSENWR
jgi:hypothetical protein